MNMEDLRLNIQIENLIKSSVELNQALIKLLREIDAMNKKGRVPDEEKLSEIRKVIL
ncbi:hypothetical protein KDU71_06875 [Carboxylicivirga sediminis]|uniref:Uncharacterized protein n=1 Tax=Carboxylicivirga sediminis TaxID=2006564 RepID=A0A941IVQ4_9BACT|nr:hypothetical protein [Carboxylicivirga sediminis]MBR8535276.1 hypothetical protein [Carboxylicivirga sediminis]